MITTTITSQLSVIIHINCKGIQIWWYYQNDVARAITLNTAPDELTVSDKHYLMYHQRQLQFWFQVGISIINFKIFNFKVDFPTLMLENPFVISIVLTLKLDF